MLYTVEYANLFEHLYSSRWRAKHSENLSLIDRLTRDRNGIWIDTFCGQGWHLARAGFHMRRVGIDRSAAQLAVAKQRNPDCFFIKADLANFRLKESCADLITNFWGSYCYLTEDNAALRFFASCCQAVKQGGALYWEILEVGDVASYNDSRFAAETNSRVFGISGHNWRFEDTGGIHHMVSPPAGDFIQVASRYFDHVSCRHDGHFMSHLVCEGNLEKPICSGDRHDGIPKEIASSGGYLTQES